MKTLLITGGAGFIGSHLCLILLKSNYSLFVVDSYINSSPESLERVKVLSNKSKEYIQNNLRIVHGDLRDKNTIKKLFLNARNIGRPITGVIHLAGLKSVAESIICPSTYWENNVIATRNLLDVMIENDCCTIVFSSSASIYNSNSRILNENTNIKALHPYANTKIIIEKILYDVFTREPNKWRIACLRYFNPIGAHTSGLIGEDPLGVPNNIFPRIIKVASGEIKNLTIFGNDWPTLDGSGVRDFIHVMDLAEGHLSALSYLFHQGPKFLNINLGTGKGTSVLELIKTFERINKVKVPLIFSERRDGDSAKVVADTSLAKSLIKFSPKRNISEMCKDGWKWYLNNPRGYYKKNKL
tara:strand:- start:392 stop:1459 length:1068 start_codon:yes stop_codon:yes gene_type:complete